jgi:excisionase family DNA binding protein
MRSITSTLSRDGSVIAVNDTKSLPLLLTVAETASLLRTSPKAVYAMIERAQLPGVTRLGRRVLVRSADLLDFLDHNRAPSLQEYRR